MKFSRKEKEQITKFERAILNEEYPYSERLYTLYLILFNKLQLLKLQFDGVDLEPDEIQSELFILCDEIYKKYDRTRSSLVPYLEKYIYIIPSIFINKLKKRYSNQKLSLTEVENSITLSECYLSAPNILFENKYIGRFLDRSEKYILYKIILMDEEPSERNISKEIGLSRENTRKRLKEIKAKITNGGFNDNSNRRINQP